MWQAVAIQAVGCRSAGLARAAVIGSLIDLGFERVAVGTIDLGWFVLVQDLADIIVARGAQVSGVDRILEILELDVVMARQAVLIGDLFFAETRN
jgi:hypothetical protein